VTKRRGGNLRGRFGGAALAVGEKADLRRRFAMWSCRCHQNMPVRRSRHRGRPTASRTWAPAGRRFQRTAALVPRVGSVPLRMEIGMALADGAVFVGRTFAGSSPWQSSQVAATLPVKLLVKFPAGTNPLSSSICLPMRRATRAKAQRRVSSAGCWYSSAITQFIVHRIIDPRKGRLPSVSPQGMARSIAVGEVRCAVDGIKIKPEGLRRSVE